MNSAPSRPARILALAISAALAWAAPAPAATSTWDGGGTTQSWGDASNWSPNGVPAATNDVIFASGFASGTNPHLNGSRTVNSLTINTPTSFTLMDNFGDNLHLDSGSLTRTASAGGNQSLQTVVHINHDAIWNINGSGLLSVAEISDSGGGFSLTKTGSGTLRIGLTVNGGATAGLYSGGTFVNAGTLQLGSIDTLGATGVTVAAGAVLALTDGMIVTQPVNLSGSGISGNGALRALDIVSIFETVRLQSNVTIGGEAGSRLTIDGVVSDGASNFTLTKVGSGTLELAEANTYGGNTTVQEGILTLSNNRALGNGASATVAFGAALNLRDDVTISQNVLLNGSGVGGNGALRNFLGDNTLSGVVLMQGNSTIGADNGSLTVSGVIAGNFSLTKIGAGSLILTNSNVYGGVTNLQEGKIRARNSGALGTGDTFVSAGAALELKETTSNLPLSINKTLHLNGDGPGGNGALRNISSNNTWAGNIILESNSTIGVDADTLTISSATSGAFNLTKVGAGTLILTSAANSHANTIVDGGILALVNPNAFPLGRTITVHGGAMTEFQSAIQMARSLNLNGTGISNLGALHSPSGSTGWTSPITLQSESSIGVDAGELRVTGAIGGSAALTKIGGGKLTLAGPDTYTGDTTLTAGILGLENSGAIPTGTRVLVSPATQLEIRGGIALSAGATLNGSGILNAGTLRNIGGSNSWSGPITLASADVNFFTDVSTQLAISGVITDTTNIFPLNKTGLGTLVLSGANTYDGGTQINGGALSISADNNLGSALVPVTTNNGGKLIIAANTTTSRTFNLNNGSLQVNAGATLQYNNATVNGGFLRGPGTHQINAGSSFNGVTALNGNSIVQSQPTTLVNFTNAGSLLSSAALTWDGGFNTPAGNITVNSAFNTQAFENDGIMTINSGGNITNTASSFVSGAGGRITINPGGQLNAGPSLELGASLLVNNGTITGTTNVNFLAVAKGSGTYGPVNVTDGGRFSPGNSPGSVTTGSTSWNSGGSYLVELSNASGLAGIDWDLWNINGILDLNASPTTNGRFTIALQSLLNDSPGPAANFDPHLDYRWSILHAADGIAGFDPASLNLDSSAFKNTLSSGHFSLESTPTDLIIHFSAIPEPSTIALFALATLLTSYRRRFR